MAISNNASSLRTGVCTSTTRPTAPFNGQVIYETDTNLLRVWTGSTWASPKFDDPLTVVSGSVSRSVPFAIATGSVYGGAVATTVTYPTSRFTVSPIIFYTNVNTTWTVTLSSTSSTSFTWQNSVGGNSTLWWLAIQMTSGSSVG